MAVGLAILANSRPYEGLLVSLPAAVLVLTWMIGKNGPAAEVSIKQIVVPIGGVLVLTGGAMAFYNWRVTGDSLRIPYQVHEATYAIAPSFLWQQPRPDADIPSQSHAGWQYRRSSQVHGKARAWDPMDFVSMVPQ